MKANRTVWILWLDSAIYWVYGSEKSAQEMADELIKSGEPVTAVEITEQGVDD